ncbi:MAG: hypothetical protein KGL39_49850 [Patescibacteria group bacterium]|nr:hypothetical protein [Patescibacteria group bacterium]
MSSPYLHSEQHFRRYEPYIVEIIKRWPVVVSFTPKPPHASVETLSTRIRICCEALRVNIHSSQPLWIDAQLAQKFLEIDDDITVSLSAEPGKVVVGPRSSVIKMTPIKADIEPAIPAINTAPIQLTNPPADVINAIMVLHHHQVLVEPTTISTPLDVQHLAESFDIATTQNGNVWTIL